MNKIEQFYKDAKGEELTKEQKKENRFTYYDMIGFADAYHSKQLIIADVSNRRETLEKFADDWNNSKLKEELIFERDINSHLKGETF